MCTLHRLPTGPQECRCPVKCRSIAEQCAVQRTTAARAVQDSPKHRLSWVALVELQSEKTPAGSGGVSTVGHCPRWLDRQDIGVHSAQQNLHSPTKPVRLPALAVLVRTVSSTLSMCACWSLSTSQVRGCSGASPTGGSWPSGARQSGWGYSGNSACLAGGRAGLKKEGEPPTPALAPDNCHPVQAATRPASPPCAAAAAGHNRGAVPRRTRGVDALARQRGLDVGGLHHRAGGQVQDGHADADLVGLVHLVHLPAGCRHRMARGRGSRGRVS